MRRFIQGGLFAINFLLLIIILKQWLDIYLGFSYRPEWVGFVSAIFISIAVTLFYMVCPFILYMASVGIDKAKPFVGKVLPKVQVAQDLDFVEELHLHVTPNKFSWRVSNKLHTPSSVSEFEKTLSWYFSSVYFTWNALAWNMSWCLSWTISTFFWTREFRGEPWNFKSVPRTSRIMEIIFLTGASTEFFVKLFRAPLVSTFLTSWEFLADLLVLPPLILCLTYFDVFGLELTTYLLSFGWIRWLRMFVIVSVLGSDEFPATNRSIRLQVIRIVTGIIIMFLTFGSAMFTFEAEDATSGASSLTSYIYFAGITLTTVGYGDIVPVTPQGRVTVMIALYILIYLAPGEIKVIQDALAYKSEIGKRPSKFDGNFVVASGDVASNYIHTIMNTCPSLTPPCQKFIYFGDEISERKNFLRSAASKFNLSLFMKELQLSRTASVGDVGLLPAHARSIIILSHLEPGLSADRSDSRAVASIKNLLKMNAQPRQICAQFFSQEPALFASQEGFEHVYSAAKITGSFISKSLTDCLGIIPLISNLCFRQTMDDEFSEIQFSGSTNQDNKTDKVLNMMHSTKDEYLQSVSMELSKIPPPPWLHGVSFVKAAVALQTLGICLIGLDVETNSKPTVFLNPLEACMEDFDTAAESTRNTTSEGRVNYQSRNSLGKTSRLDGVSYRASLLRMDKSRKISKNDDRLIVISFQGCAFEVVNSRTRWRDEWVPSFLGEQFELLPEGSHESSRGSILLPIGAFGSLIPERLRENCESQEPDSEEEESSSSKSSKTQMERTWRFGRSIDEGDLIFICGVSELLPYILGALSEMNQYDSLSRQVVILSRSSNTHRLYARYATFCTHVVGSARSEDDLLRAGVLKAASILLLPEEDSEMDKEDIDIELAACLESVRMTLRKLQSAPGKTSSFKSHSSCFEDQNTCQIISVLKNEDMVSLLDSIAARRWLSLDQDLSKKFSNLSGGQILNSTEYASGRVFHHSVLYSFILQSGNLGAHRVGISVIESLLGLGKHSGVKRMRVPDEIPKFEKRIKTSGMSPGDTNCPNSSDCTPIQYMDLFSWMLTIRGILCIGIARSSPLPAFGDCVLCAPPPSTLVWPCSDSLFVLEYSTY